MGSHDIEREPIEAVLSRRDLVATSVAVAATVGLGGHVAASTGTPGASAAEAPIGQDALFDLSTRLVGGGKLQESAVAGLADLLAVEADIDTVLDELYALAEITPEALAATSSEAQRAATNILQYWYLGRYDDQPVPNRSDLFFGLASWQVLPYITTPSLCKSFGYWAEDIQI